MTLDFCHLSNCCPRLQAITTSASQPFHGCPVNGLQNSHNRWSAAQLCRSLVQHPPRFLSWTARAYGWLPICYMVQAYRGHVHHSLAMCSHTNHFEVQISEFSGSLTGTAWPQGPKCHPRFRHAVMLSRNFGLHDDQVVSTTGQCYGSRSRRHRDAPLFA